MRLEGVGLDKFYSDGSAFAAANAQGGHATLEAARLERVEQRDDDACAAGAYRVA